MNSKIRIQVIKQKITFESCHISGSDNKVADFLSRTHYDEPLSMNEGDYALDNDDSKMIFCSITGIPISESMELTSMDPELQPVIKFHVNRWPAKASIPSLLRPYYEQRLSLSAEGGLLLKGTC